MAQLIISETISSSPSNKRLRSYLCDASIGRQGKKIEKGKKDQDLQIKKESFDKNQNHFLIV